MATAARAAGGDLWVSTGDTSAVWGERSEAGRSRQAQGFLNTLGCYLAVPNEQEYLP